MNVEIKLTMPGAKIPSKSTENAGAYDIYAPCNIIVRPGTDKYNAGFALGIETGYRAVVMSRSGVEVNGMPVIKMETVVCADTAKLFKTKESLGRGRNSNIKVKLGLVDSDYRGDVHVIIENSDDKDYLIEAGTRIAQMKFEKVEDAYFYEVEDLSKTDRGDGGFGHSGV